MMRHIEDGAFFFPRRAGVEWIAAEPVDDRLNARFRFDGVGGEVLRREAAAVERPQYAVIGSGIANRQPQCLDDGASEFLAHERGSLLRQLFRFRSSEREHRLRVQVSYLP